MSDGRIVDIMLCQISIQTEFLSTNTGRDFNVHLMPMYIVVIETQPRALDRRVHLGHFVIHILHHAPPPHKSILECHPADGGGFPRGHCGSAWRVTIEGVPQRTLWGRRGVYVRALLLRRCFCCTCISSCTCTCENIPLLRGTCASTCTSSCLPTAQL
jgi:hypothetical protein